VLRATPGQLMMMVHQRPPSNTIALEMTMPRRLVRVIAMHAR
jgi:hypothetical protein